VLAATPISRAIVAELTIWPFDSAAASRNRWKAGRLRVSASATNLLPQIVSDVGLEP